MSAGFDIHQINGSPTEPVILFVGKFVFDSFSGKYIEDGGVRQKIWLEKIKRNRLLGGINVVDYSDHHFVTNSLAGEFYRGILDYIDVMIVPSRLMEKNARSFGTFPIYLIPEPLEISNQPISEASQYDPNKASALWFGHNSNLKYLFHYLLTPQSRPLPKHLHILTNNIEREPFESLMKSLPGNFNISVSEWSLKKMVDTSKLCNYIVIPSDSADPRKNGSSPGRLVTAFALGRPVVATMLDSYIEFERLFLEIGSEAASRFLAGAPYPSHVMQEAQREVSEIYSMSSVAQRWISLIKSA